jgi:uncharacterized membrane protein
MDGILQPLVSAVALVACFYALARARRNRQNETLAWVLFGCGVYLMVTSLTYISVIDHPTAQFVALCARIGVGIGAVILALRLPRGAARV